MEVKSKVFDSTDIVDTYELLSQTPKNFKKDNYYLHELQEKVDADWIYRPNRVDIEEEIEFGGEEYFPKEVVIQSIKNDVSGEVVSDDWCRLVFKNILEKHKIGQRYRFSYDFDLCQKNDEKNIWLAVNQNNIRGTHSQTVVRCNGTLGMIYVDENGVSRYHYEPVVQKTRLNGAGVSLGSIAIDPRATLTILCQYNKYTKDYYINQRFVIGTDQVYKISGIIKNDTLKTYKVDDVGVMTIYLDIDQKGKLDDFEHRIAYNKGTEIIDPETEGGDEEYKIKIVEPSLLPTSLSNEPIKFVPYLFRDNEKIEDVKIEVELSLIGAQEGVLPSTYCELTFNEDGSFSLKRNKKSNLVSVQVKCYIPAGTIWGIEDEMSMFFILRLGGF